MFAYSYLKVHYVGVHRYNRGENGHAYENFIVVVYFTLLIDKTKVVLNDLQERCEIDENHETCKFSHSFFRL